MYSERGQAGPVSLTSVFVLIGLVVALVWIWHNLDYDTQDYLTDVVAPIALQVVLAVTAVWLIIRTIQLRRRRRRQIQRLIDRFLAEKSPERKLDLAFTLVELNGYKREGLEAVAPAMVESFRHTLKTALGDKQHRIRGMAASHLGALEDRSAVRLLISALEDDHAYVRACAALALGRMRVAEAKEKLAYVMKEDWDQTVRSRAREAFERIA